MKKHIKFWTLLILISACNGEHPVRKNIAGNLVEAKFINDSIIDGTARYFDGNNKIVSIVNYSMGVKNGLAVNFYENGRIRDSMYYELGLLNGTSLMFDEKGNRRYEKNNFFGLQVGGTVTYDSGKISRYAFFNFERDPIVICKYDGESNCQLEKFEIAPSLSETISSEGDSSLQLFMYLPMPPKVETKYFIGIENDNHAIKNKAALQSNSFFIDTLLPRPAAGWHHFVSAEVSEPHAKKKLYHFELRTY